MRLPERVKEGARSKCGPLVTWTTREPSVRARKTLTAGKVAPPPGSGVTTWRVKAIHLPSREPCGSRSAGSF